MTASDSETGTGARASVAAPPDPALSEPAPPETARPEQDDDDDDLGSSPTRLTDRVMRTEAKRALAWVLVVGGVALAVYLGQTLLLIFGAMVFAALIDGGARLLGRVLPIARGWRIAIVVLAAFAFLAWLAMFAGTQLAQEAAVFPALVEEQALRAIAWARGNGFAVDPGVLQNIGGQLMSGVGTVTMAIGGVIGGLTSLLLIAIIGVYFAAEPRLYERGVAWMLPTEGRREFYHTLDRMGYTMRRLLFGRLVGMVVEGVFTWLALAIYGVPLAALLGVLTGLLAFIPNIGALISGLLMVLVGFSGGTEMGLYTLIVYVAVQGIDGYLLVPLIARKTVDLAPALVLSAQLVLGVLFGIFGLALADPLVAMLKTALERRSELVTQRRLLDPDA